MSRKNLKSSRKVIKSVHWIIWSRYTGLDAWIALGTATVDRWPSAQAILAVLKVIIHPPLLVYRLPYWSIIIN